MRRAQYAAWNFATSVAYSGTTMAAGLVVTPLLLAWLGEERFGGFRVATDWFAQLSILDLGIAGGLMPLLVRGLATGDRDEVRRTLAAGIQLYLIVTAVMIAAAVALTGGITWLIPISPEYAADLRTGCAVAVLGLLMVPLTPFRTALEASQQGYAVHLRLLAQYVLTTVIALVLARGGWGITGQFVAVACGTWALHLAFLRRSSRWTGTSLWRAVADIGAHRDARGQLGRLNRPALIVNIAGRLGLLTDSLVVAAVLGPRLVVPLFITQRLATLAQGQLQAVGNATWAGLGHLHAQADSRGFDRHLLELTSIVSALGMAVLIPIAAYNRQFVSLWVGPDHYGGELLSLVAALNAFLLAIVSLWGWCFTATGQVHRIVATSIAATVVNLAATFVLTWRFGLVGPLLGTTISTVLVMAWRLPILLQQAFGTSATAIASAALRPALLGAPLAIVLWSVTEAGGPPGWMGLAAKASGAALAYLMLWWWIGLDTGARARWRVRARVATASAPWAEAAA